MHHPVIGQLIDCLHQREFVNKTSICSIICVIWSKYDAVMSYYEVIVGYYEVIMSYSGLLWVIPGYYGLFRVIMDYGHMGFVVPTVSRLIIELTQSCQTNTLNLTIII